MPISQTMTTTCKRELLQAIHNFNNPGGHTFMIALIRAGSLVTGTYGAATTNYSELVANGDEAVGTGYVAGGQALVAVTPTTNGTAGVTDFGDAVWANSTITASGAIIYNASAGNRVVSVLSFGADKSSSGTPFAVLMPTPDAANAIVRIE